MKTTLFVWIISIILPVYSADDNLQRSIHGRSLTELKPAEIWKSRDKNDPHSSLVHDTLRALISTYPAKIEKRRKSEFLCLPDDVKTGPSYCLVDKGRNSRKSNFDLLKNLGVNPTSWRIDIESKTNGYVNVQLQYGVKLEKGGALASINIPTNKDWELCHLYHVFVHSFLNHGQTVNLDASIFNEKKKSAQVQVKSSNNLNKKKKPSNLG